MKTIYRIIILLIGCVAAITGCQNKFEEVYDTVKLDYNKIDVKAEGGKFTFMVYCSGDWTITLDGDADWMTLDKMSGTGVTLINVEFAENTLSQRGVNMLVSGGGETKVIPVNQVGLYTLYEIATVEDMLAWNQQPAGSLPDRIVLKSNISFSGQDLSNWNMKTFTGIFEGNGYTIDDFVLERDTEAAFFLRVESGTVKDLTFGPGCSFTAKATDAPSYSASITAYATGETTFSNIVNKGTIKIIEGVQSNNVNRTGGICGSFLSTGSIDGCVNYGSVTSDVAVTNWTGLGGIVGYVGMNGYVNLITGCENHGAVTNMKVGGRVAVAGIAGFIQNANTTVTGCKNHGEIKNVGDANTGVTVAGIVGRIEASANGDNTISLCENRGNVAFAATNANDAKLFSGVAGILGGHAGSLSGSEFKPAKVTVSDCDNYGTVTKTGAGNTNMYVGGIVAFLNGQTSSDSHIADVVNCDNKAGANVLNGSTGAGAWDTYTGGVIGYQHVNGKIEGCNNYASVKCTASANKASSFIHYRLGGIVGSTDNGQVKNCVNEGDVIDESESNAGCVGGVIGLATTKAISIENCQNKGNVTGTFNSTTNSYPVCIAGIVGYPAVATTIKGCTNSGNITSNRTTSGNGMYMGGLVGQMPKNIKVILTDCTVSGSMKNNTATNPNKSALGGLVGLCYANEVFGCHSTMSIVNTCSVNEYVGGLIGQVEANVVTSISNSSVALSLTSKGTQYCGMLVGRLTHKASSTTTLDGLKVSGTFNSTALTADNYGSYCFGTGSDYKKTDNITYGTR